MSTDSDDMDIQQELKNIQNVISLTRVNIEALNAKFADIQHPPAMYLKEYEDLTSKLHELEAKERRLLDQSSNGRDSPELSESYRSKNEYYKPHYDSLPRPKFLRAHLPNQQRTSVQVREGQTLREALAKAMKLRNLICEVCCVYLGDSNTPINWDIDISSLDCEEITVKIIDKFPIPTTERPPTTVIIAIIVFANVNRMADAYYRALLARPDSSAGILHPGQAGLVLDRQSRHPGTLGHQDRSNSAPNVCINSVRGSNEDYKNRLPTYQHI
ncbi:serine/threonine-protein kinase tnni3k-related [Holotrichia oblita]|uniref:Serine/threonine-protein kinase tnni3k-related n=1 Tax=Holotrichia oblita TaxID=644536 RepID=A0ACB9SUZ7_HOLOL|nr:serine/threonine-protein kinase tnni3k-related [Holotrichia oblita]